MDTLPVVPDRPPPSALDRPSVDERGRPAVLVPIKSFDLAKGRLAEVIEPTTRADLARRMAATVIAAAAPLPVWVVCGDHVVADFARANGAHVIWREPQGLNRAVADGTEFLASRGCTRAVIAHADLPLATDLGALAPPDAGDTVYLVPDRRDDGSNVLSIPLGRGFEFHYGPGSAAAHRREASRCGLPFRTIVDADLGWDIDLPEDLEVLGDRHESPVSTSTPTSTPTSASVPSDARTEPDQDPT